MKPILKKIFFDFLFLFLSFAILITQAIYIKSIYQEYSNTTYGTPIIIIYTIITTLFILYVLYIFYIKIIIGIKDCIDYFEYVNKERGDNP